MYRFMKYVRDRIEGKAGPGQKRSKDWRKVRKAFVKENPFCAFCGTTKGLEVHYIIDFTLAPELELEPSNLITLCRTKGRFGMKSCHRAVGHFGNWRRVNPNVKEDCAIWSGRFKGANNEH